MFDYGRIVGVKRENDSIVFWRKLLGTVRRIIMLFVHRRTIIILYSRYVLHYTAIAYILPKVF